MVLMRIGLPGLRLVVDALGPAAREQVSAFVVQGNYNHTENCSRRVVKILH